MVVSSSLYIYLQHYIFSFFLRVQNSISSFLSSTYPNINPCPFIASHPSSFSRSCPASGARLFPSPGASIGFAPSKSSSSYFTSTRPRNVPTASTSNEYVTARPSFPGCLYFLGSTSPEPSFAFGNRFFPSPGASDGSTLSDDDDDDDFETTTTKMPRLLVGPRKEEEENVESFPLPPRAALRGTTSRKAAPRGTASMTLRTTTTMVQKERVEIGFNLSVFFV